MCPYRVEVTKQTDTPEARAGFLEVSENLFAEIFRPSVGVSTAADRMCLCYRELDRVTVNGGGTREDESVDLSVLHGLEEIEEGGHVVMVVVQWNVVRLPDSFQSREMHNRRDFKFRENLLYERRVG